MESFKHFGMLIIFFAYLFVQFNNVCAEGLVESNQEQLDTILEIYSENNFDESDQQPTRLSTVEKGLAHIKGTVGKMKSLIPQKWAKVLHSSDDQESPSKGKFSEFVRQYSEKFRAIFPGTRWCGDGNIAKDDNDLGPFKRTDACCRQHDKCPFNLESGESLGPLKNNGAFTRSWCACDQDFYHCLKNASNPIAREIGVTYFTVLGPQCIDYNYPATCVRKSSVLDLTGRKCLDYEYDQTQEKALQWKDSPNYSELLNKG